VAAFDPKRTIPKNQIGQKQQRDQCQRVVQNEPKRCFAITVIFTL